MTHIHTISTTHFTGYIAVLIQNKCIAINFRWIHLRLCQTSTYSERYTPLLSIASMKWLLVPNVNTRSLTNFLSVFDCLFFPSDHHWTELKFKKKHWKILSFRWFWFIQGELSNIEKSISVQHFLVHRVVCSVNALTPTNVLFSFCLQQELYIPNSFNLLLLHWLV